MLKHNLSTEIYIAIIHAEAQFTQSYISVPRAKAQLINWKLYRCDSRQTTSYKPKAI